MKIENNNTHPRPIWEDLVHDFLEVAASLKTGERNFLVGRLRQRRVLAERIELHPSFSIAGRLVVVHRGPEAEECWIYDPRRKKIRIGKI